MSSVRLACLAFRTDDERETFLSIRDLFGATDMLGFTGQGSSTAARGSAKKKEKFLLASAQDDGWFGEGFMAACALLLRWKRELLIMLGF